MSNATEPASFESFLEAPTRLSERGGAHTGNSTREAPSPTAESSTAHGVKHPNASSRKMKVGLTIDEGLVDAVDDYIYHARKQGHRLKKNDVYETALRRFLESEGIDVR